MKYRHGLPITKPKLLVGEGVDEVYFFEALIDFLGIADIQVDQYGGKSKLRDGLSGLLKRSGFAVNVVSLGITRDADYPDDPAASVMTAAPRAFQSVCSALNHLGLPVPTAHGVTATGTPNVTVFILPDGTNPGMLEDVCLNSVAGDSEFNCLTEFFACVAKRSGNTPARHVKAKADVHAWLSTRAVPDLRLGEAAQAGNWDWNQPAFAELIRFVQSF